MQHYARQSISSGPSAEDGAALNTTAKAIVTECDTFLRRILMFAPVGTGKPREASVVQDRLLPWSKAHMKLSQVLGVLRKTNRDLNSGHWKKEWIPTQADHEIVVGDVRAMRGSAQCLGGRLGTGMSVPPVAL